MAELKNSWIFLTFITVARLLCIVEGSGACFQFNGSGKIVFDDNIGISNSAHFRLKFKTAADSGVIYYADGNYQLDRAYDFEGVFLRNGHLHYFLFNPGDYGTGSSFGFHGSSKKKLNDGKWHTVEFFRNLEVEMKRGNGKKERVHRTGLKVDGKVQTVDERLREGVNIYQPITLGEDPHLDGRASSSIGGFKGRIKDFRELINEHDFVNESENHGVQHCLEYPDAQ